MHTETYLKTSKDEYDVIIKSPFNDYQQRHHAGRKLLSIVPPINTSLRMKENVVMLTTELSTQSLIVHSMLFFVAIRTDLTCFVVLTYDWHRKYNVRRCTGSSTHHKRQHNETDERLRDVVPLRSLLDGRYHCIIRSKVE